MSRLQNYFMYDNLANLQRQDVEYIEMFSLFDRGASDLMMKINVKRWEYVLYGGRAELYPVDKKVLFAMIKFKNDRMEKEKNKNAKEEEIKQKRLGGIGGYGG